MDGFISVIVPVYNVEKYLEECICSILDQTYRNFELILVDDGSNDRSGDICDEFQKKDFRVRVFHKENAGVSTARNMGLQNCQGDYITFIDSDDFIKKDYLEKLYQNILKYHVDISICNFLLFDNKGKRKKTCKIKSGVIQFDAQLNYCKYLFLSPPWGKLFRKDILEGIRFDPDLLIGEDALFVAQSIQKSKAVYFDSQTLYMYRVNYSSLTHKRNVEDFETFLTARKRIIALHEEGSMAYLSGVFCYLETCRQLVNCDEGRVHMFQNEFQKYKSVFWKVNASLKEKALLLILAYCPKIYLMFYQWVKG